MNDNPIKYRPDIDGLRAIAVLAVVFFHLDYALFSGGYIGVDIFFVISGFLISQIIYKKINNNDFSFFGFYRKRALRILPVLFVVILFSLVAGYFTLLSNEYYDLGWSSIASVFFVPNILYWLNTGYFEIAAEVTPLLHLWSLGVEEQFYILFPLLAFLLLVRLKNFGAIYFILLLIFISFVANVIYTSLDITFSFYMLFTRAWELLAGFLVMLLLQKIKQVNRYYIEFLAFVGLGLIVFATYSYDTNILFPGYYALLPVLGSMMIIFSGSFDHVTYVKKCLSNKYIVYIGLISYSLYLWHWPVAVYLKMMYSSPYLHVIILTVSVLLSLLSYTMVEQPFRGKGLIKITAKAKYKCLASIGVLILLFTTYIIQTKGVQDRLPNDVKHASNSKEYLPENRHCHRMKFRDIKDRNFCKLGVADVQPSFALFGDSHAEAFKYGLKLAAMKKGKSGVQYTKPGCRPINGIDKKGKRSCLKFTDIAIDEIINRPEIKTVFLSGYWSLAYHGFDHNRRKIEMFDYQDSESKSESRDVLFLRGLHRTIKLMLKANKRIVIIADSPVLNFNPRSTFARNILLNKEQNLFAEYKQSVNHIIEEEIKIYGDGVEFMPTEKVICPSNPCKLVKNGHLLFRDDDHISRKASAMLSTLFAEYL